MKSMATIKNEVYTNSYDQWKVGEDLDKNLELLDDHKPSFAEVNTGKTVAIFAFENSCDAEFCECNSFGFKKLDPSIVAKRAKQVPIWQCGSRDPEIIGKLPKIDMKKYLEKFPIKETKNKKRKS